MKLLLVQAVRKMTARLTLPLILVLESVANGRARTSPSQVRLAARDTEDC